MVFAKLEQCCECDSNILEHFAVKIIWHGNGRWQIGVSYCDYCGESVPFRTYGYDHKETNNDAVKSWNESQIKTKRLRSIQKTKWFFCKWWRK